MEAAGWTFDELAARVGRALDSCPGAPNRRVREVPDRRAIRWYATIGLVDRPVAFRGRTALYGPRHLLQLVAVKRRQADGRSLAEIQSELTGATDAALAAIAEVPAELLDPAEGHPIPQPAPAPVRPARFWATAATAAPAPAPQTAPVPPVPAPVTASPDDGELLVGVPLDGGAVLLLPMTPDP